MWSFNFPSQNIFMNSGNRLIFTNYSWPSFGLSVTYLFLPKVLLKETIKLVCVYRQYCASTPQKCIEYRVPTTLTQKKYSEYQLLHIDRFGVTLYTHAHIYIYTSRPVAVCRLQKSCGLVSGVQDFGFGVWGLGSGI